jgi:hypothetical protein
MFLQMRNPAGIRAYLKACFKEMMEKEVEKWGKRICVYAIRKGSLAT